MDATDRLRRAGLSFLPKACFHGNLSVVVVKLNRCSEQVPNARWMQSDSVAWAVFDGYSVSHATGLQHRCEGEADAVCDGGCFDDRRRRDGRLLGNSIWGMGCLDGERRSVRIGAFWIV